MSFIRRNLESLFSLPRSRSHVAVQFHAEEEASRVLKMFARPSRNWHGAGTPIRYEDIILFSIPEIEIRALSTLEEYFPSKALNAARRIHPVFVDPGTGLRQILTDEVGVRARDPEAANAIIEKLNLKLVRRSDFDPRQFVVLSKDDSLQDGLATLHTAELLTSHADLVEYATPNFITEVSTQGILGRMRRSKSSSGIPWHLDDAPNPQASVRARQAWTITQGLGAIVAVVDSGVDLCHRELRENLWVNPDSAAADRNGRDYSGSGTFGINPGLSSARSLDDRHGTCCAGVIGARGNNDLDIIGIAPQCRILPVKIGVLSNVDRVAEALRYAGHHADVVSCSWVTPPNPQIHSAIAAIALAGRRGRGGLVVACTGNRGHVDRIDYPARYEECLAIGASTCAAVRAPYSNSGDGINFVAPSCNNYKRPAIGTTDVDDGYIHDFGGTSASCALAAGISALLLAVNKDLTRNEVVDIFRATAERIDFSGGNYTGSHYSKHYGHGRLDAGRAVEEALASRG